MIAQITFILLFIIGSVDARCLNWCNKRGICSSPSAGEQHCICDAGFGGEDCSQRICPKAFDPTDLEKRPNRRGIRITTSLESGFLSGKLQIDFGLSSLKLPADARLTSSSQCTEAFSKLPSVDEVYCNLTNVDAATGAGIYEITFKKFPLKPFENNLFSHNGNPPLSAFKCNTSGVDFEDAISPLCTLSDTETSDLPVYAQCSNHGVCNTIIGKCDCEKGYHGDACDDTSDFSDRVVHVHDGPFFTATLLKVHADRSKSPAFNVFQAVIGTTNITTITGDGELLHNGDAAFSGKVVVSSPPSSVQKVSSQITTTSYNNEAHLVSYNNDEVVAMLDHKGKLVISGGLTADNGSFVSEEGLTTMAHARLTGSLDIGASAHIEESLSIGSGFVLTPTGMTVDVATHSGTLFELTSRQTDFHGSMFEIHAEGNTSSMIKTVVDGDVTFELSSSGDIKTRSLRMLSGGVDVEAGGIRIEAGGLDVRGGITLSSGGLNLLQQDIHLGSITAVASSSFAGAVISASTSQSDFSGNFLEVTVPTSVRNASILQAVTDAGALVADLSSAGSLFLSGGASVQGEAGLEVRKTSALQGGLVFSKTSVQAGQVIDISVDGPCFVTIVDDGKKSKNEITLPNKDRGAREGQVLIVSNSDEHITRGAVAIPPGSTILLLYDGERWVDVQALQAPMSELKNVRVLEADNDLDIGNVTFTAGRLRASRLSKGSVLVSGSGGVVTEGQGLTFATGVLHVPALKANKLSPGMIDAQGADIVNVELTNSKISKSSASFTDLTVVGNRGIAFFDATGRLLSSSALTVDQLGQISLTDIYSNVDLHQNTIRNAVIENSLLENIKQATIKKLILTTPDSVPGSLTILGSDGEVVSTGSDVVFDFSSRTLRLSQLGGFSLQGTVDFNSQDLKNAEIISGSISGVTSVTTDRLAVTGLKAASVASRIVSVNKDGVLQAQGEQLSAEALKVADLTVTGTLNVDGALIKNAKLDPASIDFGTPATFSAGVLTVSSLAAVESAPASVLVSASADGTLKSVTSAALQTVRVDQALTVAADATLTLQALTSSLLAVDAQGQVVTAKDVEGAIQLASLSTKDVVTDMLTVKDTVTIKNLQLDGLTLSAPQLLTVDTAGRVAPSASASVDSVSANTITVTGAATVGELTLSATKESAAAVQVLGVSADGRVVLASNAQLQSLAVSGDATVDGLTRVGSLEVKSLLTNSVQSAALKEHLVKHSSDQLPLVVSKEGKVERSEALALDSLAVVGSLTGSGETHLSSLSLSDIAPGAILSASSDGSGKVVAASAVAVPSLAAEYVSISGLLETGTLKVSSFTHADSKPNVLVTASDGVVKAVSAADLVQTILASTPPPADASYSTVSVADRLTAKAITLQTAGQSGLLQVDSTGSVSVLSRTETAFEHVSASGVDVTGAVKASSVSATNLEARAEGAAAVVSADSTGKLIPAEGLSHAGGVLTARGAKLNSLSGLIDASAATLSHVHISDARIESSTFVLPQAVSFGSLVVRGQDGGISSASAVSVDAAGSLVTASIKPTPGSKVSIASAAISDSIFTGGEIKNAEKIEAAFVTVSQDLEVRGNTNIDGNLNVQGSVVGSRPYMDSSDSRFKIDVQPIKDALKKVVALEGVTFKYDVKAFPDRGFGDDTQIGWIADKVLEVAPELVEDDREGYKAVAYARAVALVAQAVKELQQESAASTARLTAQVAELQQTVQAMQTLIASLNL